MSDRAGILVAETFVHTAIVRSRGRRWKIIRRQEVAADVPTTLQEETDLDALADVIREAVRTVEGVGLPAHLIVPSSWCFHQALAAHTRRFDDQAAAFQLEEHLPLPLEEVACAFARRGNGQGTGVAIRTSPIRRLLDRLGEGGVCVERLYVDSFVAAAGQRPTDQACGTLVLDRGRLALSITTPGSLQPEVVRSALCSEASQVAEVVELTKTVASVQPSRWRLFDLRSDGAASLPDLSGPAEHLRRPEAAARLQLAGVEHARDLPDLCNAALAPAGGWHRTCHLAARCVMLATLLLFLWSGDLYRQSRAYRDASRLLRAREVRLFKETLPDSRVPASPALRLASERIRLEGLTRAASRSSAEAGPSEDRHAAIDALRHFVAALPQDVRVGLQDWSIDRSQLSIRGQTADHRDAERITEAVNAIPGQTARPPRTSRLKGGGVAFTIRATRGNDGPRRRSTLADAR